MTLKENDLLIRDLSARLPYGLRVHVQDVIEYDTRLCEEFLVRLKSHKINLKPYLRPMSSMTDEEKRKYNLIIGGKQPYEGDFSAYPTEYKFVYEWEIKEYVDFVNSHHLDYRGLIPKDIAIEAPDNMYV